MVHKVLEHHDDKGRKVKCLSCGSPYEGFFCFDCHSLLSFSGDMDYFAMLDVEKRPVIDPARLKENFLKLSEYVHPDKYYNSSHDVQELALKSSSLLNKAYSTLKDPKERIRWERALREVAELDREWLTDSGDNRKTKVRRLTILSHELSYLSKLQSLIDELIIALS